MLLCIYKLRFEERRTDGAERKEIFGCHMRLLLGDDSGADSHIDVYHLHLNGWDVGCGQSVHMCCAFQYADQSA